MATDVQAAPSPATAEAPQLNSDPKSYTEAEYSEWRKSGTIPAKQPVTEASAAPTSAEEAVEDGEESETAPAPEAGNEIQQVPHRKNKVPAPVRIKELLADKKRLESELAEARKPKPEQTQENKPAEAPKGLEAPKKPEQKDFADWDKYEAAREKYFEDVADYKAQKRIEEFQAKQVQEAALKSTQEKLNEGKKKYTDYEQTIKPVVQALNEKDFHPAVRHIIEKSPVLSDLLYAIGQDSDNLADFVATSKSDPALAIRKAVLIEKLVIDELSKPAAGTERDANGKFVKSEEKPAESKRISAAPPIAEEAGGKGAAAADILQAAVKNGDVTAYMTEQNRRDLASRKG